MSRIISRGLASCLPLIVGLFSGAASAAPLEIKGLTVGTTEATFKQQNKGAKCGDSVAPSDSLKGKWPVRSCTAPDYTLATVPTRGNFHFYPGGWGSLLLRFDANYEIDLLAALRTKYGKPQELAEGNRYRWEFDDAIMTIYLSDTGHRDDSGALSITSKVSAEWDRKQVEAYMAETQNDL